MGAISTKSRSTAKIQKYDNIDTIHADAIKGHKLEEGAAFSLLLELPSDVLEHVVAHSLDRCDHLALAMTCRATKKRFFDGKMSNYNSFDYVDECARLGHASLLRFVVEELHLIVDEVVLEEALREGKMDQKKIETLNYLFEVVPVDKLTPERLAEFVQVAAYRGVLSSVPALRDGISSLPAWNRTEVLRETVEAAADGGHLDLALDLDAKFHGNSSSARDRLRLLSIHARSGALTELKELRNPNQDDKNADKILSKSGFLAEELNAILDGAISGNRLDVASFALMHGASGVDFLKSKLMCKLVTQAKMLDLLAERFWNPDSPMEVQVTLSVSRTPTVAAYQWIFDTSGPCSPYEINFLFENREPFFPHYFQNKLWRAHMAKEKIRCFGFFSSQGLTVVPDYPLAIGTCLSCEKDLDIALSSCTRKASTFDPMEVLYDYLSVNLVSVDLELVRRLLSESTAGVVPKAFFLVLFLRSNRMEVLEMVWKHAFENKSIGEERLGQYQHSLVSYFIYFAKVSDPRYLSDALGKTRESFELQFPILFELKSHRCLRVHYVSMVELVKWILDKDLLGPTVADAIKLIKWREFRSQVRLLDKRLK